MNIKVKVTIILVIIFATLGILLGGSYIIFAPALARTGYEKYLNQDEWKQDVSSPSLAHYGYIYLDNDNIPELAVIGGTNHTDQVFLYQIEVLTGKVRQLGAVSINGTCQYIPKTGIVLSQYGNMGYYFQVCSKLEHGDIVDYAVFLSDANSPEGKYYTGLPLNSYRESTGTLEQYQVSVDEYKEAVEEAIGNVQPVSLTYANLTAWE